MSASLGTIPYPEAEAPQQAPPTTAPAYGSGQLIRMSQPTTAFHGTPHEFSPTETNPLGEFDLSKLGTGEGAQAYGHGTYLAANEAVAKGYKDALSSPPHVGAYVRTLAQAAMQRASDTGLTGDEARRHALDSLNEQAQQAPLSARQHLYDAVNNFDEALQPAGNLYQAELHIHPDHMLDWDKPLGDHSQYVQERLGKLGIKSPQKPDIRTIRDPIIRGIVRDAQRQDPEARNLGLMIDNDSFLYNKAMLHAQRAGADMEDISPGDYVTQHAQSYVDQANLHGGSTGEFAHRKLAGDADDRAHAAKQLLSVGIPGIRYLDQGSRGGEGGTHNYVVFDPRTINIVRRNGLPAMVEAGADALRDHKKGTP